MPSPRQVPVARVEAWPVRLRMDEPYAVAYASADTAETVFLRLTAADGVVGHGCAAPDEVVTGETPADALRACLEVVQPGLAGEDPDRADGALPRVLAALARQPSVRAALAMALLDLDCRRLGVPAWKRLGATKTRLPTSVTIGILDRQRTLEAAAQWVGRGFRRLKIKGGLDWEADAERLAQLRERLGHGVRLSFDANQGFDRAAGAAFLARVAPLGLEFVEQPTPAGEPAWLGELARGTTVPLMADEGLLTLADAERFAADRLDGGGAALFNVKLMKVGTFAEASALLAAGERAGIKAMVGCMDEAAVAIAAGLAFALASPSVVYADLDGHFGLPGDPTAGAVGLVGDELVASELPGLGLPATFS